MLFIPPFGFNFNFHNYFNIKINLNVNYKSCQLFFEATGRKPATRRSEPPFLKILRAAEE
jgi:hypothetical protein